MTHLSKKQICVIGAGPSGLMACEELLAAGLDVHLYERMPSLGRKFLMAGKSGLNITHHEPLDQFVARYPESVASFREMIAEFTPSDIRSWVHSLGIETFVGSSGRVFPTQSKAAPLLRAWIRRMKQQGLIVHVRHHWQGWDDEQNVIFDTPNGIIKEKFDAFVYAMGGGSWARLGSDGRWVTAFQKQGQEIAAFQPRNMGFEVNWSHYMAPHYGQPVKTVGLSCKQERTKGDFIVTPYGVEGSAIYSLSRSLDLEIRATGQAVLRLDLSPDRSLDDLVKILSKPRGKKSLSSFLKNQLSLSGAKRALLYEGVAKEDLNNPTSLAHSLKNVQIRINAPRPIDEAISTAGGLCFNNLDDDLMITARPGHFACGEMLDWEAPTGGYLLSACFATGKRAALGVVRYLAQV